jgi:NIMA (never in mitosis gene a)-related kinase
VLYELAALHRPFSGCSMPAVVVKILRGVVAPLSPVYSAPVHALASALLDRDPRTRPSMEQVRRSVSATHGSIDWLFVCHSQ